MLRNLIVLPDGTEIFSGVGTVNAVQSTTITSCVNSGTELTPGSVCAAVLDMKLITPRGNLDLKAGDEITLYKVPDSGDWTKVGLFTLETPARPSMNTYQITAYDRVSWLDRDLSLWFESLASGLSPIFSICSSEKSKRATLSVLKRSFPPSFKRLK